MEEARKVDASIRRAKRRSRMEEVEHTRKKLKREQARQKEEWERRREEEKDRKEWDKLLDSVLGKKKKDVCGFSDVADAGHESDGDDMSVEMPDDDVAGMFVGDNPSAAAQCTIEELKKFLGDEDGTFAEEMERFFSGLSGDDLLGLMNLEQCLADSMMKPEDEDDLQFKFDEGEFEGKKKEEGIFCAGYDNSCANWVKLSETFCDECKANPEAQREPHYPAAPKYPDPYFGPVCNVPQWGFSQKTGFGF